jgi:hypothetical protein
LLMVESTIDLMIRIDFSSIDFKVRLEPAN